MVNDGEWFIMVKWLSSSWDPDGRNGPPQSPAVRPVKPRDPFWGDRRKGWWQANLVMDCRWPREFRHPAKLLCLPTTIGTQPPWLIPLQLKVMCWGSADRHCLQKVNMSILECLRKMFLRTRRPLNVCVSWSLHLVGAPVYTFPDHMCDALNIQVD